MNPRKPQRLSRFFGLILALTVLFSMSVPVAAGDPDLPSLSPQFTVGGGAVPALMPVSAIQGPVAVVVYTEFVNETEGRVLRRFSEDGGLTWSTAAPLWDQAARFPHVAIVGNTVHVAFEIEDPVTLGDALAVERSSTDGGKTFGPVVTVGNAGPWSVNSHFAGPRVGGYKNTFWITWVDENGDLRLRRQQDGGVATFTSIEGTAKTFLYSLASDGNNIYVLSEVDDSGAAMVLYKSTDAGLTFAPGKVVAEPRARAYEGMALAAFGRRVVMAWKPPRANTLQVRVSKDRAATFGKAMVFKGDSSERVALFATLDRIEMLRVLPSTATENLERLALYVLPKRAATFKKPLILRRAPRIGFALFGAPTIASDNVRSVYAWFEFRSGTTTQSRSFVRVGQYLQ